MDEVLPKWDEIVAARQNGNDCPWRLLLSWLRDIVAEVDLSDWETKFVDDMVHRLAQYQHRTAISDKQFEVLERLHERATR